MSVRPWRMEKDWDKFPFVQEEPKNIDFGFKMAGGSLKTNHVGALCEGCDSLAKHGLQNLSINTQHFH